MSKLVGNIPQDLLLTIMVTPENLAIDWDVSRIGINAFHRFCGLPGLLIQCIDQGLKLLIALDHASKAVLFLGSPNVIELIGPVGLPGLDVGLVAHLENPDRLLLDIVFGGQFAVCWSTSTSTCRSLLLKVTTKPLTGSSDLSMGDGWMAAGVLIKG